MSKSIFKKIRPVATDTVKEKNSNYDKTSAESVAKTRSVVISGEYSRNIQILFVPNHKN